LCGLMEDAREAEEGWEVSHTRVRVVVWTYLLGEWGIGVEGWRVGVEGGGRVVDTELVSLIHHRHVHTDFQRGCMQTSI